MCHSHSSFFNRDSKTETHEELRQWAYLARNLFMNWQCSTVFGMYSSGWTTIVRVSLSLGCIRNSPSPFLTRWAFRSASLVTKGERKCHDQIALTTWWRPDGVLNGHGDLMVSKMAYFGLHLVPKSHLGHHQVAEAIWSPFGHGTCVHLK